MVVDDLDFFYKDKKVFVTGHTGFKGSWLITRLNKLGAHVKGYARTPLEHDLYNTIDGDRLCDSVIADIRDCEKLKKELLAFNPDFVFHLAAQALVRLSYQMPVETFDINVQGTANILDALRYLHNPCVAIMITTDKVYENPEKDYHFKETDRLGGYDPYSASKTAAEIVINSYRNSFFHNDNFEKHRKAIAVARAGNVIGGGDWSLDRIMPDIIQSLHSDKLIVIRNPNAVRPWQHVLDPIAGYLRLGICLQQNTIRHAKAYNFGPNANDSISVEQLVKISIDEYGKGAYEIKKNDDEPYESSILKLDISLAKAELGWTPKWSESEAIRKTIRWYIQFYEGKDSRELIEEDMIAYNNF